MFKYYTHQQIQENPGYVIQVYAEDAELLRARIQSRFIRSKHHNIWFEFKENRSGVEAVKGTTV